MRLPLKLLHNIVKYVCVKKKKKKKGTGKESGVSTSLFAVSQRRQAVNVSAAGSAQLKPI